MGKGHQRTLDRAALKGGTLRPHIIPFDLTVDVADGAPGFGSAVIRGLPEGNIFFQGAVAYVTVSDPDGDLVAADFEGDFSIGTAPTADGALAGAEVNIIASTPLAAATAGVSPRTRATNITPLMLDNTAGDLELNLNVLIDDADISAAAVLRARGELHIAYMAMGDD